MHEFDEDDEGGGYGRVAKLAIVAALAVLAWFLIRPMFTGGDDTPTADSSPVATSEPEVTAPTVAPTTAPPSTSESSVETTTPATPATSESTTVPDTASPSTAPTPTAPAVELPDGRPIAATAIFTNVQVVVSGVVPDEAAHQRVIAFAESYRLTDAPVVDDLTVDPDAEPGGLQILEYNGERFDREDAAITPAMGDQLARIVDLMIGEPGTTVHVIGNVDAGADPTLDFALSQRQASSVRDHLIAEGIATDRISTQPGGSDYPLSLGDTDDDRVLNRRADLVVFGLLG